jgi:hypothetical protein
LVYRRAKHDIDLFIWPGDAPVVPAAGTVRGYNFLSWTIGGMALHAVSDIEPAELRAFMQAWAQAPEDAAPPVPKSP